jgi:predicted nucleic-acid-binding protein
LDEPVFVDTNVFLRFFVRDVEPFYIKASQLFEKAENGMAKLETSDLVIAEIVWVLESYYGFKKSEVREVINSILETKNLKVANGSIIKEAVSLYELENIDFIDAYNIIYMKSKNHTRVATFDVKHFKTIEGIKIIW